MQFLGAQHALECLHERRKRDGKLDVVKEPAQVFQGVGHALEKMSFTFVIAAKTISAQCLHDADVNVGVVVPHERFAIEREETREDIEIMIEQLLAQRGRQIGLGIVQERSDVILQRALAAALVVHKKRLAAAQQNVS